MAEVSANIGAVQFSPDGKLVTTGGGNEVYVWETQSGTLRWRAEVGSGNEGPTATFSPDGKTVFGASTYFAVYDAENGHEKAHLALDDGSINTLVCTPDGRTVVAGRGEGRLTLHDSGTLKLLKTAPPDVSNPDVAIVALAVHPNGKIIAVQSPRGITLWDPSGSQPLVRLVGHASSVVNLNFSADGSLLATKSLDGTAKVWNLTTGKIVRVFPGKGGDGTGVAFSPDHRTLASSTSDGQVFLFDLESGKTKWTRDLEGQRFRWQIFSIAFSPDGKLVAAGNESGMLGIWEAADGKLKASFAAHDMAVSSLAFSPDSRTLATASVNGEVKQWDPSRFKVTLLITRIIDSHYNASRAVAYSPDGRILAAADGQGQIYVWEAESEKPPQIWHGDSFRTAFASLAFSPDGHTLAATTFQGTGILWDVASGKARTHLAEHLGSLNTVAYSPNGRVLATGGDDATVKFWNAATGALLATSVELDRGQDWIVTTPDGRFDGTSGGQRLIEFRIGEKLYALEQFFNSLYTPGLLTRFFSAKNTDTQAPLGIKQIKLPPRVHILSPQPGDRIKDEATTVKITVEDQGGGASPPVLYLNGHRLPTSRATRGAGNETVYQVPLVEGRNKLHASAFNGDSSIESRGDDVSITCEVAAVRKPVLYVLAIGVDRYENGMRLAFAKADAGAIASFFKPGLFGSVKVTRLTDEQASKKSIQAALKEIEGQSSPQDTLLLYLAGHGTLLGEAFYYLPFDAKVQSDEDLRRTCLSAVELGTAMADIPATKQVIILDACHSGASTSALGKLLSNRDSIGVIRAQQRLARSSGSFLISAATAEQYAKEFPELGHGVLTYSILHALGEKGHPSAQVNGDGQVTVNSLLRFVSDEVPALAAKYQGGRQDVVQFSTGQDFPLVVAPR